MPVRQDLANGGVAVEVEGVFPGSVGMAMDQVPGAMAAQGGLNGLLIHVHDRQRLAGDCCACS